MRFFFTALVAAALAISGNPAHADVYLLDSRLNSDPSFTYTPSPEDWRDINIYQIFTDRFHDGDPSNNNHRTMRGGTGWYGESTTGKSWHNTSNSANANERHLAQGGDWEGLRQKIPYLVSMGVKSVWISSVMKTEQGTDKRYTPYHAYHPTDLYRCEPLFGDVIKLRQTIDELHANGIYVILDVVPNHLADLSGLGNGQDNYYHPNGGGNLFWWDGTQHAAPFNRLDWIHNNGKILNWDSYPETQRGAFVGTDDLDTDRQDVRDALEAAFKNLIDATDCDGFRVDAIKHVDHSWIKNWATSMRQHASYRGKDNFLVFGELFSFDDNFHSYFTQDEGSGFNSVMWFTMMNTLRGVFTGDSGTNSLTGPLQGVHNQGRFGEGGSRAITFIDNHDVDRAALNYGGTWEQMLRPAMGLLYCAAPVPTILYGTEHGFNQGGKPNSGIQDGDYQRECMMDFGYQWGNAQGDKFNTSSPIKDLISQLNAARDQYACLRRGDFTQRWESGGRGIYAFTRSWGDQEALIILNTDWGQAIFCNPAVSKPNGTEFINVLNPSETLTVSGGTLSTSVPVRGLKIFVTGTPDSGPSFSIQNTRHWPSSGNIESGSVVYIDSDTTPKDEAVSGEVIVSIDGGETWSNHALLRNPSFDGPGTDAWNSELGTFPAGVTVQFAVNFTAADGAVFWESNGGQNFEFVVNAGSGAPVFEGIGDTTPASGAIGPGEDLIITTRSHSIGTAVSGIVVYNSGAAWAEVPLVKGESTNTHDTWSANLGTFGSGTTIRFAVMLTDGETEIWDNNNTNDYSVTVSGGDPGTGEPTPLELLIQNNSLSIRASSLVIGEPYVLEWSQDLRNWFRLREIEAGSETETMLVTDNWPGHRSSRPSEFYRLIPDEQTTFPAPTSTLVTTSPGTINPGDNLVLTAESQGEGSIVAVSVVYNTNAGASGPWPTAEMLKVSSTDGTDFWSVDLGNEFTAGQSIHYAVRFQRADGGSDLWENNGSENFVVTVSGGGGG